MLKPHILLAYHLTSVPKMIRRCYFR